MDDQRQTYGNDTTWEHVDRHHGPPAPSPWGAEREVVAEPTVASVLEEIRAHWVLPGPLLGLFACIISVAVLTDVVLRYVNATMEAGDMGSRAFIVAVVALALVKLMCVGMHVAMSAPVRQHLRHGERAFAHRSVLDTTLDGVLPGLVALTIVTVLTALGLVALILPGLVIALMLSMAPYLAAQHDYGVLDALRCSWRWTRNHAMLLITFGISLTALSGTLTGPLSPAGSLDSPVLAFAYDAAVTTVVSYAVLVVGSVVYHAIERYELSIAR